MFQTEKLKCTAACMFFILRTTAIELNSCMRTLRAYLGVLYIALRRPSSPVLRFYPCYSGRSNIYCINRINGINGSREITPNGFTLFNELAFYNSLELCFFSLCFSDAFCYIPFKSQTVGLEKGKGNNMH